MQHVLTTSDHYAKPAVITVRAVLKHYQRGKRTVEALRGVSLEVNPGQIFCLLGPNGAGKTTLIKIVAGTLLADGGQVFVNGHDVRRQRHALAKQLGVVFETAQNVYGYLTVEQNLRYFGYLGKVPQMALDARVQELLSLFDLLACRAVPANRLSRGMQQKLALAVALLKHPSVLLLDEPTLGLDVMAAATIKSIVKSIAEDEKRAVLLTTHNMPLAEELGHYFAFIDHGRIVWQGSKHDLRSLEFFHCRYLVRAVQNGVDDIGSLKDALAPHCLTVDITGNTVNVSCAEPDLGLVINQMAEMKATIESVARVETTLEEVFMQIFQKGDAGADALGNTV